MNRFAFLGAISLALGASDASGQCPPDADADGHPIFFSTYTRIDIGYLDDQVLIAAATDVAFGDVDGDGDLDAAFALSHDTFKQNYITISLNRGDGVFGSPALYMAGREVAGVALDDFDGDGDLDAVAVNARDDTVSVFLNDGSGSFGEQAVFAVGAFPRSAVARDFNADGLADLAVLNTDSNDVSILLATGDSAFAPESRVFVGNVTPKGLPNETFPYPGPFMDAGDIDADGDIDLAIPCKGVVKLLINDGEGAFTLSPDVADVVAFDAYDVVLADLNADGRTDVAAVVTSSPATVISVLLQNEDGSWAPPATLAAGAFGDCPECFHFYNSLAAGDLDNDGNLDLALGEELHEFVGIYRNNGDGTFADPEPHFAYDGTWGPWVVELEDLNGDGWADLGYLNGLARGALHAHLNDGAGQPVAPHVYDHGGNLACGFAPYGVAADMDLDGHADLVLAHDSGNCAEQITIHRGDGSGGFSPAASLSVAPGGEYFALFLNVADVNGDGLPDIVVPHPSNDLTDGAVRVILNEGGMSFGEPTTYELEDSFPWQVAVRDLDGDGDPDIVASTVGGYPGNHETPVPLGLIVLENLGNGEFLESANVTLEELADWFFGTVESRDLDADGDADLLATTGLDDGPARLWRLTNDGAGNFEVGQVIDVGMHPTSILARDFDLDGTVEVALMFSHSSGLDLSKLAEPYLVIFENDGTGELTLAQELINPNVEGHWVMHAADINADAYDDIVMPDLPTSGVLVHLNNGDGTFGDGVGYDGVGNYAFGAAIADFDEDGRTDIALTQGDYVSIHLNRACPPCPADVNNDATLNILDFIAFQQLFLAADPNADCDHDGRLANPADFICFQQLFNQGCD